MGIGLPELLIILVIVFLVFGAGKLPEVMSQLGKGVNAFKEGATEKSAAGRKPAVATKKAAKPSSAAKKVAAKKPLAKAKRRKA